MERGVSERRPPDSPDSADWLEMGWDGMGGAQVGRGRGEERRGAEFRAQAIHSLCVTGFLGSVYIQGKT